MIEFSFRTRHAAIQNFEKDTFDFLVIGGGITGAAVARDAASRGLRVALVEQNDFAYGTSSRSSKLIHGGLRYLQNMEFHLVFEALAERALLLKTVPHLVRPLPFYFPVYQGDPNGRAILSLGMWLYDTLALFRSPGFHKRLSRKKLLGEIPFLKKDKLQGGFRYFDASMWDDVLAVEIIRSAHEMGAQVASYVRAEKPIWDGDKLAGFVVRDLESEMERKFEIRAHQIVVCAGPWTDDVASKISPKWQKWIKPSKGVHLIFDLKRIPMPGAMVMSEAHDGRIAFVIPRPDFGAGVVIVGTTDGPTLDEPHTGKIHREEVEYLLGLLNRYFPDLKLTTSDILSAYVGVRPLMGAELSNGASPLQKVSREHHIDQGPGGSVVVAGGKYTTHRKMGQEIVDYALTSWHARALKDPKKAEFPFVVLPSETARPVNPNALPEIVQAAREKNKEIPEALFQRYGGDAVEVHEISKQKKCEKKDPDGFPELCAQLRYAIRTEMVMHLEDFYIRRLPLFASRADHGKPWTEELSKIWAEERDQDEIQRKAELQRLEKEMESRSAWKAEFTNQFMKSPVNSSNIASP